MTPHQHARANKKRSRKTKKKNAQQGDKPWLHSNGTQTGERKETDNNHIYHGALLKSKNSVAIFRDRVRMMSMLLETEVDDNSRFTHIEQL